MGRLFFCAVLSLMLLSAPKGMDCAQPVFFSMLFPRLTMQVQREDTDERSGKTIREAVFL